MSDPNNKSPEEDRLTIPDSPVAKKESQPSMPAIKADEVSDARLKAEAALRAERENKAHTIQSHVMGLSRLRRWMDDKGHDVGMVNQEGGSLRSEIEEGLLRTGMLVHRKKEEGPSKVISERLAEAASLMDEGMADALKAQISELELQDSKKMKNSPESPNTEGESFDILERDSYVEDRIELEKRIEEGALRRIRASVGVVDEMIDEIKAKVADLEKNPDYLFQFKVGGAFRDDLTRLMEKMLECREVWERDLISNGWVMQEGVAGHFTNLDRATRKRNEMRDRLPLGSDGQKQFVSEATTKFELNEEDRSKILELAQQGAEPVEIAKRMPGLIGGQLDILFNSIASQAVQLFQDQEYGLGDTDAESMNIAIKTLNQCLFAQIDIHRTKKLIASLD